MIKHPDEMVPADMPKDLDRVHSALDAASDLAPDGLLERILASRAAGERTILPVDHATPSRLRRRVVRGAIAAMLGLVALGGWSIWSHRNRPQTGSNDHPPRQHQGTDFGFTSVAEAQTPGTPKYDPMVLIPARLHAARLRYAKREFMNGKLEYSDTLVNVIEPVGSPVSAWRLSTQSQLSDPPTWKNRNTVFVSDTMLLHPTTLRPVQYTHWVRYSDGGWGLQRFDFGDTTIRTHFEMHDMQYRPVPTGKEPTGVLNRVVQDTNSQISPSRYPRFIGAVGDVQVDLMAAKLAPGLRASLVRLGQSTSWVKSGWIEFPLNLIVDGDERIDSPVGKIDCWKLRSGTTAEVTYWVRKTDGVLIRKTAEQKTAEGRYRVEMILMSEH